MEATLPSQHQGEEKFFSFIWLAMLMAVITGIELVVIYMPAPDWFVFSVLVVLSVIKFLGVIFWFMHLKFDKAFCTIVFLLGMFLASGTVAAVLLIFNFDPAAPVFDDNEMGRTPGLQLTVDETKFG